MKNNNEFANILKKYNYNLLPGDIVAGTIIYKEKKGFLVNIGDQIAGYLPNEEIRITTNNQNTKHSTLVNRTVEFLLMAPKTNIKQYILSIKRLEYIRGWKRIKQLQKEEIIFHTTLHHINKGGIITYLEGIQGFIPKSHIYLKTKEKNKLYKDKIQIQCKILIINEKNNQLILSNKSAILFISTHKFKFGEIIYGKVKSIKPYGLFIDLYGITALLHISEIKSIRINNIQSYFKINTLIKVKVINIDIKQGRISVSRRNIK